MRLSIGNFSLAGKKIEKWADSFRKFKQFPLPKDVFRDFSLISDLVHRCPANNECFQFQHSVSSLPAQSNLHFLIGNYFSNCFLKNFSQEDCGTLNSTLYIMDAFKTNGVHCKLQNALDG